MQHMMPFSNKSAKFTEGPLKRHSMLSIFYQTTTCSGSPNDRHYDDINSFLEFKLCLRKKCHPFIFVNLCQMSSNFANSWQKRTIME